MKKPIIDLYTICWNEEEMLGFFFRHYDPWVSRYVFYDDGSTDGTLEMLKAHPRVEIRSLERKHSDSYVEAAKEVHDNCWKESKGKADWVIISAVDELLYHPDFLAYLKSSEEKGVTTIPALGYQMLSEVFPEQGRDILKEVRDGAPKNGMNKLCLFKPDSLEESNYDMGRHWAYPQGDVMYPEKDELLNLHFKYLNFDHTFARNSLLNTKLGQRDIQKNWAYKYAWSREKMVKNWEYYTQRLHKEVIAHASLANETHSALIERWWRNGPILEIIEKSKKGIEEGQLQEAISQLIPLISQDMIGPRERAVSYSLLTRAYHCSQQFELADETAEEGLQLFPKYLPIRYNYAESQLKQGNWEAAIHAYDKVLELDPDNSSATIRKEQCLKQMQARM